MNDPILSATFEKLVKTKFSLYNSLFLNLPYPNVSNIGVLIPLLYNVCLEGLEAGNDPRSILDHFFSTHTNIRNEQEKIDFMFRVIQYVERQVVLYDSVEDAAFAQLLALNDELTVRDYLNRADSKENLDLLIQKLAAFSTRIVLTAHPTQFYPPAVLDIISKLIRLITKNDINKIDLTLQQLGLTSLINSKKPTPVDEAKNIIYFLQNVFYDGALELYSDIRKNIRGHHFDNPSLIQFGFWPGGDRDGNPFVTADITNEVADELRMSLMKCYYRDIKSLQKKLTFRKIEDTLGQLKDKVYVAMFDRMKALTYEEIIDPLREVKSALVDRYNSLYLDLLEDLIDKVQIFRVHFAALDIRQNHRVHKLAVEAILKKEGLIRENLEELEREELIKLLLRKKLRISFESFEAGLVSDTIRNISQIKEIQRKNGEEGCNRYIISNSEDIFSVLFVYGLTRWCGWHDGAIPLDIIPLFESMEGMANAESIMRELFEMADYRNHLRQRDDTQTVMLGFSDGTKDGGYLQANWSIFKTKETLSALCEEYGIRAIFFDGRGGPPARGGGKTHRFYASQSEKIANHGIQVTIQGQTITSKYGTREHFINNSEQLLTAGLSHHLHGRENVISGKDRALIEELAHLSFEKYTALKHHEKFLPYLEKKSTLKYYSRANIGSRPSRRGDKDKLDLQDLRAISFVGSWSQLKQNVPGYFGVGTAIRKLVSDGKQEALQQLFQNVPFFRALILNSMMSLKKCYFALTAHVANDAEFGEFWKILYDEFTLSKEMTLLISQYGQLMEEEPISRRSVEIREQIVLPLLVIQQYALQQIERDAPYKTSYEKIVERSLYGNINASRNSA